MFSLQDFSPRRAPNLMTVMAAGLVVQKVAGDLPVPNVRNVLQALWAQLDLLVPGLNLERWWYRWYLLMVVVESCTCLYCTDHLNMTWPDFEVLVLKIGSFQYFSHQLSVRLNKIWFFNTHVRLLGGTGTASTMSRPSSATRGLVGQVALVEGY